MELHALPRDVWLLVGSALLGVVIGAVHARIGSETSPVWPVRLYLFILTFNQPKWVSGYAKSRNRFAWREQFMASSFIWFFFLFILAIVLFGCGGRTSAC